MSHRSERPGQDNCQNMDDAKTMTTVRLNTFGGDDQAAMGSTIELATAVINEDIAKDELTKRRGRGLRACILVYM